MTIEVIKYFKTQIRLQVSGDNSMFQQNEILDMEIESMRILMMQVHEKSHTNVRKLVNFKGKLNVQEYTNKESG